MFPLCVFSTPSANVEVDPTQNTPLLLLKSMGSKAIGLQARWLRLCIGQNQTNYVVFRNARTAVISAFRVNYNEQNAGSTVC